MYDFLIIGILLFIAAKVLEAVIDRRTAIRDAPSHDMKPLPDNSAWQTFHPIVVFTLRQRE